MTKINNDKKDYQDYEIEDGFRIMKIHNKTLKNLEIFKGVDKSFLQLHFCIKNEVKLNFNQGKYAINILENNSLLLYNPQQDLPIYLEIEPEAKLITLLISIKKFHTFFSKEAGLIHFLNDDNKEKKYYLDKDLSPNEIIVLNLVVFATGSLLGIFLFTLGVEKFYFRFRALAAYLFAGLIIGSSRVLWPFSWSLFVVLAFILGFLLVWYFSGAGKSASK